MSVEKQTKLVERLIERTAQGEIDWVEGLDDGFQVSFSDNTLRIEMLDSPNSAMVRISLINSDGYIAESFDDEQLTAATSQGWFAKMRDLLYAAQRKARGADKILDDVLRELE
jgi:hypothetical protein